MRASTASLILAFCAAVAVQAAPLGETNGLSMRSAEALSVFDARALGSEIEVRDPKKK